MRNTHNIDGIWGLCLLGLGWSSVVTTVQVLTCRPSHMCYCVRARRLLAFTFIPVAGLWLCGVGFIGLPTPARHDDVSSASILQEGKMGEVLPEGYVKNAKCEIYKWGPAVFCPRGRHHWSMEKLTTAIPEFAEFYRHRPISYNLNGMNANHAFTLWFTVRQLKPKYIIESGVNMGQSTWFLRMAAGPETHIFSLDPRPPSNLRFRDDGKTRYFMGKEDFKDVGSMDWARLIPVHERNQTFLLLDDHMSSVKRVFQLLAHGFLHFWYDDNWKDGDCYSFNTVCSALPEGSEQVLWKDIFGKIQRNISLQQHNLNLAYLQKHMEIYFEFPALLDGCDWPASKSLLTHDGLSNVGLPSLLEDRNNYIHFHPPYVKLRLNHREYTGGVDVDMDNLLPPNFNKSSKCNLFTWGKPVLCPGREQPWSVGLLTARVPDFGELYRHHPVSHNISGMSANQGFSLWFTVQQLKPKYIVESGVGMGQATWIARMAAGPDTQIFSLDPRPLSPLYWDKGKTQYFMGEENYTDIGHMDWSTLIPRAERNQTLVLLRDAAPAIERVRQLLPQGFLHLWYDDGEGWKTTGDHHSFNTLCSGKTGLAADTTDVQLGNTQRTGTATHDANLEYLRQHTEVYFEFPAILDGCAQQNSVSLLSHEQLALFGLPNVDEDGNKYVHSHPPYVKLRMDQPQSRDHPETHNGEDPVLQRSIGSTKCGLPDWGPPTLCRQGERRWSLATLTASIPQFADLYRHRPNGFDQGPLDANHAFSLWFTTRQLKPTYIIQSGTHFGLSTWILRVAAGSDVPIFSFDPEPPENMFFQDDSFHTHNFMAADFRDIGSLDWSAHIPSEERHRTLVVLNDHMSSVKRVTQLLALGFLHLWYNDNSRAGDCYSFNTVCSEVAEGTTEVQWKDDSGRIQRNITMEDHRANLQYLREHMEIYFEFPPLFDACQGPNSESLLKADGLERYGLSGLQNNHRHFHPPYVKLRLKHPKSKEGQNGLPRGFRAHADCEVFHWSPPMFCLQGQSHWSVGLLTTSIPAFAELYRHRPLHFKLDGINTNHAFSMWFTAQQLQPMYVIDSGVYMGQSTWILRMVLGPNVKIFSLDARPPSKMMWRDHGEGMYFMGKEELKDIDAVDWSTLIPAEARDKTLVLLNDHASSVKRVEQLGTLGFVHLWYHHNLKDGDCYSFNTVCSEVPAGATEVLWKDDFGRQQRNISIEEHQANLRFIQERTEVYFEFPPLYDGCNWPGSVNLLKHEQLKILGLPALREDRNNYMHFHPAYVRLRL